MKRMLNGFIILLVVFIIAACNGLTDTEVYETEEAIFAEGSKAEITEQKEEGEEADSSHAELLQSLMDDNELLARIDTFIGAPLRFDEDDFWGLPFIAVLPNGNVILSGHTGWSQMLTVYLRPIYIPADDGWDIEWFFEAYDLGDGIVLVEPFTSKSEGHRLSDEDYVTMRIYHAGLGWSGDWYGFLFDEIEISSENWVEDAISHIREITGIGVRDIWYEGSTLHILESPLESYVAWGPAYERRTFLYLTAASLPGVEHVFLTGIRPARFSWMWEDDFTFGFEYTGRRVHRGHHWAWAGGDVGERTGSVLEFFERQLQAELVAMAEHIHTISNGEARLDYFSYEIFAQWIGGENYEDSHRLFYEIQLGELWLERAEGLGKRIPWDRFRINEDLSEIFWISLDGNETMLTLDEWRASEFYRNWLWD